MTANSKIEPEIGEIITIDGIKFITQLASGVNCLKCAFQNIYCWNIVCNPLSRKDGKAVIFKKVETNMKEVKIQIPDNCELVKDGDTYIVKEKKQEPPRSWEEFCKRYPVKKEEASILVSTNGIYTAGHDHDSPRASKSWCTSEKEAEAFLALMQLRQLRKSWVGDWKQTKGNACAGIVYSVYENKFTVSFGGFWTNIILSFPTKEMAEEFLICFRDLCETAKTLL